MVGELHQSTLGQTGNVWISHGRVRVMRAGHPGLRLIAGEE